MREQIDGGEKLVRQLAASGFPVSAALWAKAEGDGQLYLYVATPEVDDRDPRIAYGQLAAARQAVEGSWSHPLERVERYSVKLIPPSHPLARAVLDEYRRYPGTLPTRRGGSRLGTVDVEGAYIYPPSLFQPQPQAG